jgi:predicted nucleic acid-binding protein
VKSWVIDASVVAAAFFQEEHAAAAQAVLASGADLQAPDLIVAEVMNVVWKRHARHEIDEDEAGQLLTDFRRLPIQTIPSIELIESALSLALRTRRTVYDCLYVALAVKAKATLLSADRRLVNALAGGALAGHVVWIGERR